MDIDHDPLTSAVLALARTQESHTALLQSIVNQQAEHTRAMESLSRSLAALTQRMDDTVSGTMVHALACAVGEVVAAQAGQGVALLDLMGDVRGVMRAVGAPSLPELAILGGDAALRKVEKKAMPAVFTSPMAPAPARINPAHAVPVAIDKRETAPPTKTAPKPEPAPARKPPPSQPKPTLVRPASAPPKPLSFTFSSAKGTTYTYIPPPSPEGERAKSSSPPKSGGAPKAKSAPKSAPKPVPKPKPTPNPTPKSTPKAAPKPTPKAPPNPDPRAKPPFCVRWNEGEGLCKALVCPLLHECFACRPAGRLLRHRFRLETCGR